ncbi:S8 family serine peptidase [Actinoallomurus sp. CA-150999]|uniref:S8 family peptidase n=1 Tax=Actinoallomurus sp. CA-150999 TaxID=3239887 RepID=UPI003D8A9374
MPVSEPRRTFPRLVSALLVSAAVAVLSVPAAQSAVPGRPARPAGRTATVDLYRGQQWTLGALHLPRAWKYSRGDGVTVAVLDTGVDGHQPDLTGRVVDGPDFTGHARKPGNRYWGRHGTEMASLIAGHGHGAGGNAGIMGVAPEAKILSIRVTWELNDPMRDDHAQVAHSRDAIAKGIRYATDHGAQVISMSLGGGKLFYNGNPLEETAIKYALGKGVVLVASSGNDGATGNRRNYPAAYPGVIAVGAVDRAFKPTKFTNRHTYVSVSAPGVEIVSADVSGHGYVLGTGTSSSAALVAGMSALVKARYPRLTPDEVKQTLEEGTTHRPADGRNTAIGTGVADALGTLRTAARINKAEHGGAGVKQPDSSTTPAPTGSSAKGGPDLMLVAVLSGGGTLLVLSLILGWRQRRRRLAADRAAEEEETLAPVAAASPAESDPWQPRSTGRSPRQSRPPGPSPWEPRSDEPSSPWEPRPAERPSPWEPRPTEPSSSWEPLASDSAPERSTDASAWRRGETDASPRSRRPEEPSPWQQPSSDASFPDTGFGDPARPSPSSPVGDRSPTGPSPFAADRPPAEPPTGPMPAAGPAAAEPPRRGGPGVPPPDENAAWSVPLPSGPSAAGPEARTEAFPAAGGPVAANAPSGSEPGRSAPASRTPLSGATASSDPSPAVGPDVRSGGAPDPLSDAPIDSSSDVGTPLAEESWESIRRGFDRLKEDTRNWGSPLLGGETGSGWSTSWSSASETADPPPAEPDDKSET